MLALSAARVQIGWTQCCRHFSRAFLGNELQTDLKRLYLLVHPDVMGAFPESVKTANKNSIQVRSFSFCDSQVLNSFLEDTKPYCDSKSGTVVTPYILSLRCPRSS